MNKSDYMNWINVKICWYSLQCKQKCLVQVEFILAYSRNKMPEKGKNETFLAYQEVDYIQHTSNSTLSISA